MIISRTPYRISFFGGGTDYPSWYQRHGGCVLSTTIDKYCYITARYLPPFHKEKSRIVWSKIEAVQDNNEIEHPSVKSCLEYLCIKNGVEIHHQGDLPARSGLGSSSAFTVGLINALRRLDGYICAKSTLAALSVRVERDLMRENVGIQDQIACAYGGFNLTTINKDGRFVVSPVELTKIQDWLLLFYTGISRTASTIAAEQIKQHQTGNIDDQMHQMQKMPHQAIKMFYEERFNDFGELLHEAWLLKRSLASNITSPFIDSVYNRARKVGAIGGKICFPEETMIKTAKTEKKINLIKRGDIIIDAYMNPQIVTDVTVNHFSGKLISITANGMERPIKATPEHPFMLSKKSNKIKNPNRKWRDEEYFIAANKLQKGNCLLIPIDDHITEIDSVKLLDYIQHRPSKFDRYNSFNKIPNTIPLDDGFLNLIGWYIAEGSGSKKQFNFAMNRDEINIAKNLSSYIFYRFGKKTTIKTKRDGQGIWLIGTSTIIAELLKNLCGKLAHCKKIPSFIMYLPPSKQSIVLRALWLGDGCVLEKFDKRTNSSSIRCSYKTVSKELAYQTQLLCHRLGFICGIKKYRAKKDTHHNGFVLDICGDDAKAFSEFIKTGIVPNINRKNKKSLSLSKTIITINGTRYIKRSILSIKKENFSGKVYNLSVTGSHTYIANNIAVHNCGAGGGGHMLFCAPAESHGAIKEELKDLLHIPFKFENNGSQIIFAS